MIQKRIKNFVKAFIIEFILIFSITTLVAVGVKATDLNIDNLPNNEELTGALIKIYTQNFSVNEETFKKYFNNSSFTALSTNHAIYCLTYGKSLFDQGTRSTFVRDHEGNIDMDKKIKFEYGGQPDPASQKFSDYMQDGESDTRQTDSNIRYVVNSTSLRDVSTNYGHFTGNIIPYAATFESSNDPYFNPAQYAIWQKTHNNGEVNSLYKAGYSVDALEEQIAAYGDKPTVTAEKASDTMGCGTTYENGNYVVGPFHMSNYAYVGSKYAKEFSGKDLSVQIDLVGGIESGYITLNNGKKLNFGKEVTIKYKNVGENNRSYSGAASVYWKDTSGNIINFTQDNGILKYNGQEAEIVNEDGKMVLKLADGTVKEIIQEQSSGSDEYWGVPENYTCPFPNSDFYVVFSRSDAGNATTLSSFSFKYRKTRADGSGWIANGEYVRTIFTRTDKKTGCTTYSGTCASYHGVSASLTNSKGGWHSVYHTHYHTCYDYNHGDGCLGNHSCGGCTCPGHTGSHTSSCPKNCKSKHTYKCSGCTCPSNHSIAGCHCSCKGHSCSHTSSVYFTCTHGHTDCKKCNWQANSHVEIPQPLLGVGEAHVDVTSEEYTNTVNVRLTTDLQINKYITKVEHVGEAITTFDSTERKRPSHNYDWKKSNTLKIEKGDKVTYRIDVINNQNQKVSFQVQDVLPKECANSTFNPNLNQWLEVEGNTTYQIEVTLRATADSGIWENQAEIVTRNSGDKDYNRTDYRESDNRHNGPVVNIAELDGGILKDSDFYEIKEYNVNVEKYIYDVEHDKESIGTTDIDTTMPASEERASKSGTTEDQKKSNPVYVEYGDVVTYKIDVYNTVENTGTRFDVNRGASPYWNPDKVYVNVEDTLPKQYSKLQIDVEDVSGAGKDAYDVVIGNGTFTIKDLMVPAGGKRTITVSLVVEEHAKNTIEENKVKFNPSEIKNINRGTAKGSSAANKYCVIKNNAQSANIISSDWYKINDYKLTVDKYISKYNNTMTINNNNNQFTEEEEILTDRYVMSETDKKDKPLPVEKTETLVYSIRLTNDATTENSSMTSGVKRATQVRPTKIQDKMDVGLTYKSVYANIYKADGSVKFANIPVTHKNVENNTHTFEINNRYGNNCLVLDPTDYIIYEVTVEITESNMYLYSLGNTATILTLTDINHDASTREIKNNDYNENIAEQQESSDYVKLKDLVISGKVWLDRDKDGYMGTNGNGTLEKGDQAIDVTTNPSTHLADQTGKEYAMKGIVVKLYSVGTGANNTDTLVRTTKTDENGLFTFGRQDDGENYYPGLYTIENNTAIESEQRIPKADNKDANKNYTANSKLIKYYVEYEYDGLVYKSTENYSNTDNLGNYGELINNNKYKIDSNAYEFTNTREAFNKDYEIISYNQAVKGNNTDPQALEYEKSNHESYIRENNSRIMTSRSFIVSYNQSTVEKIKNAVDVVRHCGAARWRSCNGKYNGVKHLDAWAVLIDMGLITDDYDNTTEGRRKAQADLTKLYEQAVNATSSGNSEFTKYLWLYRMTTDYQYPETEYLKYINLGLEEREDVDISITQDVYELKTTINGEEMTYEYNQNNYTLGNSAIDKEQEKDDQGNETSYSKALNSERFITGYKNDTGSVEENKVLYNFQYYLEDYNYRVSQYHADTVRAYKGSSLRDFNANAKTTGESILVENSVGRESELNTEITFRIKVTNNAVKDDEIFKNRDTKVETGINEIVEYYDKDFVNLIFDENGTVKGFNVKTKDANGYLVNKEIKVVSAKAVMSDGTEREVTLSNSSKYNATRTINNYDTLYITPTVENTHTNTVTGNGIKAGDMILSEGESLDILITFVVEKEVDPLDAKEIRTILGAKENVAEISAYSTYYKDGDNYKSAGLIDKDSNPGNFGEVYGGVSNVDDKKYIKYFEDDTFKTGITLTTPTTPPPPPGEEEREKELVERTLSGFVWDDARSEEAKDDKGTQYIGNGIYTEGDSADKAKEAARRNEAVSNKEINDIKVQDVKTELIEVIRMPDPDDATKERIYEDTIYVNGETGDNASVMTTRTDSNGKYKFKGYVPGEYIVRFTYGDDKSKENMLIFNGQDYKSTTYQGGEAVYAENATANGDMTAKDVKLQILEKANTSDAKDDEIRRLETIGYSETMNNDKNEILKGKNSSDKTALVDNTYMFADTTDFLVRPEKKYEKVTVLKFAEHNKIITEITRYARFKIENIDFGLQYRPELQLALNKYISNITVTTSDTNGTNSKEPLIDAHFDEFYGVVKNTDYVTGATNFVTDDAGNVIEVNADGSDIESKLGSKLNLAQKNNDGSYVIAVAGTKLNENTSIGLQNLQYLPNEYIKDSNGNQVIEEKDGKYLIKITQGFAYIVIDDNLLQGATISIKYLFTGTNISEIDRIASNLSDLRFKENKEVEKYAKTGAGANGYYDEYTYQVNSIDEKPTFVDQNYSAARTARNALFSEYFRYELDGSNIKTYANGEKVVYQVKAKDFVAGDSDKIIAIQDIKKNPEANNLHSGMTGYYGRYLGSTYYTGKISPEEVVAELKLDKVLDYIDNDLVFNNDDNKTENSLWKTTTSKELYDEGLLNAHSYTYFDDSGKKVTGNTITNNYKLLDAEDRAYDTAERSNLALSLDDRVRDDYSGSEEDTTVNKEFSKFLLPRYSNSSASFGTISLLTSKVLSPEDKTDDMTYENIAEIIQYTSVTGRITNLATTIGNVKIEDVHRNKNESPEFYEGRTESDTASVERVTLTPPTGLSSMNQVVREVVQSASYTVLVIIVVGLVCVGITVGITLYHKRRIK